jgi:hypothetical protein
MNSNQVLSAMVEGLYRDKASDTLPAGLSIAPAYAVDSARAEFLVFQSDTRFDARKDGGKAASFTAQHQRSEYQLNPVSVQMNRHPGSYQVVPEAYLASIPTATSILQSFIKGKMDEIYGAYTAELQAAIASAGLLTGTALNLTTQSTDLTDAINDTLVQINLASGKDANTIYMSRVTFNAIMNNDQVQAGSSISGFTSAGSAVRRLGSATPDAVYAFFKTRFNLDLVVDGRTFVNSSGVPAYAAGNNILITHSNPGMEASAFKTFYLQSYSPADLIKFDIQETRLPDPIGQSVTADAVYQIKCIDPSLGATMAVTL